MSWGRTWQTWLETGAAALGRSLGVLSDAEAREARAVYQDVYFEGPDEAYDQAQRTAARILADREQEHAERDARWRHQWLIRGGGGGTADDSEEANEQDD